MPSERAMGMLEHLHVIDCDAHFTEPPDLWSSRGRPRSLRVCPCRRPLALGGDRLVSRWSSRWGCSADNPSDRATPRSSAPPIYNPLRT